MKRNWTEIICDGCGGAEHFSPTGWKQDARQAGWIITARGEHYCTKACKAKKPKARQVDSRNALR